MGGCRLTAAFVFLGLCALFVAQPSYAASSTDALGAGGRAASDGGAPPLPDVVSVAFRDCDSEPLGKQAFLKFLALELGRRQLRESGGDGAVIAVNYRCDGLTRVRVVFAGSEVDREVRVDDVAARERARTLALAVAELTRGGEPTASRPDANEVNDPPATTASTAPAAPRTAPSVTEKEAAEKNSEKQPKRPEKQAPRVERTQAQPDDAERSKTSAVPRDEVVSRASARSSRSWSVLAAAAVRLNMDVTTWAYGAALGVDYARYELSLEGFAAKTGVARGSISMGVAALRVERALPLVQLATVELGVSASAAAGVNWALGNSTVVNTHVRDVLMPYADAKASLWATTRAHNAFTPKFELFAGRAAGIVATADGAPASALGGWFSGCELGLWL